MSFITQDERRKAIVPLPDEKMRKIALKKAEKELNESSETKKNALHELKFLFKGSQLTRDIDFEEDFLVHYLRANKYSVKKTFHQIQNYVDLRKKDMNLFSGLPDKFFSTENAVKAVTVLPVRCPDSCLVAVIRLGYLDEHEISIDDIKKGLLMVSLQLYRDPMVQINGYKVIYDFKGTGVRQLRYATFQNLWLLYHIPLNCIPARQKGIHFINQTVLLKPIWTIMKPLLSEKLKSRTHFHSDPRELLDYFPRSMLPAEYGGELSAVSCTDLLKNLNKEQLKNTIRGQPNFYRDII